LRVRVSGRGLLTRWVRQDEGKCAGAALLAAACTRVSLRRFAASADGWAARLHPLLRASESERVRCAACACATALVLRAAAALEAAPSLRRDVSALLSKATQLLLPQLRPACVSAAGPLSAASLRLFAAAASGACAGALRSQVDRVEAAACAALHEEADWDGCCAAAELLAALPRVQGDAAAWSSHARRLLLAAHAHLDACLRGCEAAGASDAGRGCLEAPGEAPPRPLDPPHADTARPLPLPQAAKRAQAWIRVAAALLESPYPVPVPFPAIALWRTAQRVLQADGRPTSHQPASPALLMALPGMHVDALRLMAACMRSGGSAGTHDVAVPFAALLKAALRSGVAMPLTGQPGGPSVGTCAVLRCKLYDTCCLYAHTYGGSFALALGADLLAAAVRDLAVPRHSGAATPGCDAPKGKKRKKEALGGVHAHEAAAKGLLSPVTPSSLAALGGGVASRVRCAALRALEALCVVAGGVLPERTRADLDAAVARAAVQACQAASSPGAWDARCTDAVNERNAALAALLATVLAPRPRRAPNLPLAMSLFRQGCGDPQTAQLCGYAVLSLEALLHPVAPPQAPPRDMLHPSPAQQETHMQLGQKPPGEWTPFAAGWGAPQLPQSAAPPAPVVAPAVMPSAPTAMPPLRPAQPPPVVRAPPAAPQPVAAQPVPARPAVAPAAAAAQQPPAVEIGESDSEGPLPDIVDAEGSSDDEA